MQIVIRAHCIYIGLTLIGFTNPHELCTMCYALTRLCCCVVQGLAQEPAFGKMNLTLSPVPVGGGSLARVQSDALPLTLHADMLTLPDPSTEEAKPSNRTQLADLSDFNSTAVEISSSDSMSSSRVSVATSNQSSSASLVTSQQSVSTSVIGELHNPIPAMVSGITRTST